MSTTEPTPPPPPGTQPRSVGYPVGIALLVIGIIGGIAAIAVGAGGIFDNLSDRQTIPLSTTDTTVQIDSGADQRIWFVTGDDYGSYEIPAFTVEITGPDGRTQRVFVGHRYRYRSSETGSDETEVGRFRAEQDGRYTFRAVGIRADGTEGSSTTSSDHCCGTDHLQVGPAFRGDRVALILLGVFGGGLLTIAGIITLIVTAVRRSNRRRDANRGRGWGGGGWGQPQPAWGPPQPGWGPPAPGTPGAVGPPWGAPPVAPPPPPATPGWAPPPMPSPPPLPPAPGGSGSPWPHSPDGGS